VNEVGVAVRLGAVELHAFIKDTTHLFMGDTSMTRCLIGVDEDLLGFPADPGGGHVGHRCRLPLCFHGMIGVVGLVRAEDLTIRDLKPGASGSTSESRRNDRINGSKLSEINCCSLSVISTGLISISERIPSS
jgi:hypothetical protein